MYYVWITLLLAALILGMGAGMAFGCRMEERRDGGSRSGG